MLRYHHMLTRYGTRSQVLILGRCNLFERNTTPAFSEWWSKMFIFSTYSLHASDSKRKRSDLFEINILEDEGKLGSKPKLKIPFVLPKEDGSSHVKILGIDVVIPTIPIPAIHIQSIKQLPQVIKLTPEGAENIMDILNVEPNPTEYMAILIAGVDITPLESKVEGLIKQACDFKDLQQSYSDQTSAEEHDSCRMEVQCALDEASHRLNTEGVHYEAKTEAEHEVIDLQGQIGILNATKVMDVATKASLEKVEVYIKEAFEDLKNFQWNP
ncbi:hypothetical protein Cgig2_024365 [Carnegiea gigantea]|uniref:Uncharacterized protein n=1 Tax=Carnegiea gigantea TaxID=171969 RepID=A0A9Q1JMR9_9CARY|nr:hypothetical protein Cgig2_024365 [Carnegiea gigantea]